MNPIFSDQSKAKLLAWNELNVNETECLISVFKSKTIGEIYNFMQNMFYLDVNEPKDQILLDLHYYATKFAIDNDFTKIQVSSFLSILRTLHRTNLETPLDNYESLLKFFHQLMICHSVKRPPFCLDVFDHRTAIKVIDYIRSSYLRHYKSYKYVFTPIIGLNLTLEYLNRPATPPEVLNDPLEALSLQETNQQNKSDRVKREDTQESRELREFVRQTLKDCIQADHLKEKLSLDLGGPTKKK